MDPTTYARAKCQPIRFGIFEVDLQAGELRKQGLKVKLQEQPFQILAMLLERPGEVVTRDDIQKRLWPADTFVDFGRGLNRATNRLRESLGDQADSPRFIETLPRRGYRFIAPVEATRADSCASSPEPSALCKRWLSPSVSALFALTLLSFAFNIGGMRDRLLLTRIQPRIKSLAVLPLESLSGDPAQEYFANGMTDELITEIARIGSLRVISRTSSMQYKGSRKSLPAIAKELGVDAIAEGTMVRSRDQVRITARLIEARSDRHLWSEEYERNVVDVLTLEGDAQAIAGQIRIKLTVQQRASLTRARPINPQALEAYLKGYFFLNKGTERLDKSIAYFTQSTKLDPGYGPAYAGLAEA